MENKKRLIDILEEKRSLSKVNSEIPFRIFYDMRSVDFNNLPNVFIETQDYEAVKNPEPIHLVIGPRGSGKSLLLKFQEHFFLETIGSDEDEKILPVWFDMGDRGYESKNSDEYDSETEFHVELVDSLISSIASTCEKIFSQNFWSKFKFWRHDWKKMKKETQKKPFEKEIFKNPTKIKGEFLKAGLEIQSGKSETYTLKRPFSLESLKTAMKICKEQFGISWIKIIFDEVSTLSKIESRENAPALMNSILQQWFFDFVDISRSLKSVGLSYTIAMLSEKTDMGSHFSPVSHAKQIWLDYDYAWEFKKLSGELLDKRIFYYSDEKYNDFSELFEGKRTDNAAKEILDKASSGVPRTFLHLCQECYKIIIKKNLKKISPPIVRAMLKGYAIDKERRLSPYLLNLYKKFLFVLSKGKQSKFVLQSEGSNDYTNIMNEFMYNMFKQEIFIRKRSYIIIDQALWRGTSAVPNLRELDNTKITEIGYNQDGFIIIGEKEEEQAPISADITDIAANILDEEISDISKNAEKIDKNTDIEEPNHYQIPPELQDITKIVSDDLVLSTDITFPRIQVKKIIKRQYNSPLDGRVFDHCITLLQTKTIQSIKRVDEILKNQNRIQIKESHIENLENSDVQNGEIDKEIFEHNKENRKKDPEYLILKTSTLRRIIKDMLPYTNLGESPAERFINYLESYLESQLKAAMNRKPPQRKMIFLCDFQKEPGSMSEDLDECNV